MDRTGLKILENNKNIQSIISVNTNILLRRFRLKFLRIMCSTSYYKEHVNFENILYMIEGYSRQSQLSILVFIYGQIQIGYIPGHGSLMLTTIFCMCFVMEVLSVA
jgi:hypothetical protein